MGIDTFPYEFYRNGEEWKIEEIYIIFKAIFKEARPPNEWNKYTIKLIHKGGNKNKQDIENYHPIALINTICKILCGIVNIGITEVLEKNCLLWEEQQGFSKDGRAEDNILALNEINESYN